MSRFAAVGMAVAAASILAGCAAAAPAPTGVSLPAGVAFDYQLGGGYSPAQDVGIVVRDRTDAPEPGVYSICYINAFQTQPGELADWPDQSVLMDADGQPVHDADWPDEALLDISSPPAQIVITARVGEWIRGCASDGFDAVELDNLDSFTRSGGALSADDASVLAGELVVIAHEAELAVGQKNAAEHTEMFREESGFDFAISEECAAYRECTTYTDVYGAAVLNIEYTDALPRAFAEMCADPETPPTTILRDRDLTTPADGSHVREVC